MYHMVLDHMRYENGADMALVFYGRSSSAIQESGLAAQIERAKALGIDEDHIFAELVSGK